MTEHKRLQREHQLLQQLTVDLGERPCAAMSMLSGEPGCGGNITNIHSRMSSPTCEDLGIPRGDHSDSDIYNATKSLYVKAEEAAAEKDFCVNEMVYDHRNPNNPFSPYSRIPLPNPFQGSYEYGLEPAFIRKRNERERERVRCVNEGYLRLRQHLPVERKDKRVSKVETLRCAIRYIHHLQAMLNKCAADNTTSSALKDSASPTPGTDQEGHFGD